MKIKQHLHLRCLIAFCILISMLFIPQHTIEESYSIRENSILPYDLDTTPEYENKLSQSDLFWTITLKLSTAIGYNSPLLLLSFGMLISRKYFQYNPKWFLIVSYCWLFLIIYLITKT